MKYWFYSEGNILGPYEPAEMLALPAFAEESLVCPESCTGDNPGDWRPASQVAEIGAALSVGSGRMVAAGPLSASYELETGFSSSVSYFENREPSPTGGYGELLGAIDNILGAYKETAAPEGKAPETDYDFAEKFDIRLSRIQEELEAARWEKNLLLEKIRMKEQEDKKNRARIEELEARLKGEAGKRGENAREIEQVRHLSDLKEKADTLRQIEEIKKEELAMKEEAARDAAAAAPAPAPADAPAQQARGFKPTELTAPRIEAVEQQAAPDLPIEAIEVKAFKSIKRGAEIKLESAIGKELKEEAEDDPGLTSRKLKSLGQTQAPAYVYGSHYDKPLPGPEAAPAGAFKPEALDPLPQQAGGLVYDFTVVTSRPDVQQFQIEPRQEAAPAEPRPVKPPTYDFGVQQPAPTPAPAPAPAPQQGYQFPPVQHQAPAPAPAPALQPQHTFQFAGSQPAPAAQPQHTFQFPGAQPAPAPQAQPVPAPAPAAAPLEKAAVAAPDSPDKTLRMPVSAAKAKADAKASPDKPKRKGGRTAFVAVLVIFGSIAAGGLGYFFMGEGGGFPGLSKMIPTGKVPSGMTSQTEAQPAGEPAPEQAAPEQTAPEQPAPAQQAAPKPAAPGPQPANENIKKALDIVKNYKLSGGRGTIASWFANSFLSGSGGDNEEWTATPLHGDSLVVQYRLLRPRQEPLIYQFEVDAAKLDIVRGINNNAIELLDLSGKDKTASAAPAKKQAKPKVRKPARSKELPILPLPDAPAGQAGDQDPTGFENPQAEGSEQVKYLKAQESDEELF
ncbi:MAG: hypothetical protein A2X32_02645 [Elusimicrobia bacterium GWC2_64_44]|nr:MAG: hypothetical protein A2X32_02645 [Elusimicrobia bacterium GWC2_64_44]